MWSFPSLEERRRSCSESSLRGSISDLAPYDIPEVVGTASELLFNRMLTLGTCVDVKQKASYSSLSTDLACTHLSTWQQNAQNASLDVKYD